MSGHDKNVTPGTTGSSQQNRPENGTQLLPGFPSPDRIAEIRARLDAATPRPWKLHYEDGGRRYEDYLLVESHDVGIAEVNPHNSKCVDDLHFIAHAPADIAWLLEQVEELTKRVRMYEVVKS
jgi:hypothetical protein